MKAKILIPLVLSVLLGTIAAVMAKLAILHNKSTGHAAQGISVVVLKGDVSPGQQLTADDLTLTQIAAKAPPKDAFVQTGSVVGRVAAGHMIAGEPVLETLLTKPGTPAGLEALIPVGQRAITVDVTESSGMGGLLVPGARVDAVAMMMSEKPEQSGSRAIAQNIRVLATGQRVNPAAAKDKSEPAVFKTVTLLVSPREAAAVDLASSAGRVRLVMRGTGDNEESDDEGEGVLLADLRGTPTALPVATTPAADPFQNTAPTTRPVATEQPQQQSQPLPEPQPQVVRLILGNEEQRISFRPEHTSDQSQTAGNPTDPAVPQ